jgi:rare lipoprotein A
MRSRVSLVAALLAAVPAGAQTVPLPPEAGTPAGPSGTAGTGTPGGYDAVVYAEVEPGAPGVAIVAPLPTGSYAEVTDLASGRTILASVAATAPGVRLSASAAQALGVGGPVGVRVRAVGASPADAIALRQGGPASARLDAPEAVLRALRRQLPARTVTAVPTKRVRVPRPPQPSGKPVAAHGATTVADVTPPPATALRLTPPAPPAPKPGASYPPPAAVGGDVPATRLIPPTAAAPPAASARFVVQVATVPAEERARNLARTLSGLATRGAAGWQVRLGPFADLPAAQAARDDAVNRGYADAAIFIAD